MPSTTSCLPVQEARVCRVGRASEVPALCSGVRRVCLGCRLACRNAFHLLSLRRMLPPLHASRPTLVALRGSVHCLNIQAYGYPASLETCVCPRRQPLLAAGASNDMEWRAAGPSTQWCRCLLPSPHTNSCSALMRCAGCAPPGVLVELLSVDSSKGRSYDWPPSCWLRVEVCSTWQSAAHVRL